MTDFLIRFFNHKHIEYMYYFMSTTAMCLSSFQNTLIIFQTEDTQDKVDLLCDRRCRNFASEDHLKNIENGYQHPGRLVCVI